MHRTSFMLGVALMVVAATMAITITLRRPPESKASASRPSARSQRSLESQTRDLSPAASSPSKSSRRVINPERFSVSAPQSHPNRALLAENAQKVEAEAMGQLERLTERLELTGEQRRRLFPILARTSEQYDPAMTISGLSAGAPPLVGSAGNQELNRVLDPPQRERLVEDAITDQVLWQEIVDKLRQRLDEETPQILDGEPEAPEPTAPASRGRSNLFDALQPQE